MEATSSSCCPSRTLPVRNLRSLHAIGCTFTLGSEPLTISSATKPEVNLGSFSLFGALYDFKWKYGVIVNSKIAG